MPEQLLKPDNHNSTSEGVMVFYYIKPTKKGLDQ